MFEMIFVVCLAAQPDVCFEQRPPFQPGYASATACLFEAQFWAIDWLEMHPHLRLQSWKCETPEA